MQEQHVLAFGLITDSWSFFSVESILFSSFSPTYHHVSMLWLALCSNIWIKRTALWSMSSLAMHTLYSPSGQWLYNDDKHKAISLISINDSNWQSLVKKEAAQPCKIIADWFNFTSGLAQDSNLVRLCEHTRLPFAHKLYTLPCDQGRA